MIVLTPFCVIEVHKLFPLIVSQETQDGSFQGWPHLDDELHICICGEARGDEGRVEGAAERRQGVHGHLVIESKDGINSSGEL